MGGRRRIYATRNQLQFPGLEEDMRVPEWEIVQEAVQRSLASEPSAWQALEAWQVIEVYTDGSAPISNPGGPAGFAAVVVGFEYLPDPTISERPTSRAKLN